MEFLSLKRNNNIIVENKKAENYIKNKKEFLKYNKLNIKYKENYKDLQIKLKENIDDILNIYPSKIITNIINDKLSTIELVLNNIDGNYTLKNYKTNKIMKERKKRYNNIISLKFGKNIYLSMLKNDSCIQENKLYQYYIMKLLICYNLLLNNGNFIFKLENYCSNKTIDILYLCLILFEEVTIYGGLYICCKRFNPRISKESMKKNTDKDFIIFPKDNLNNLSEYLNKSFKFYNNIFNLIFKYEIDKIEKIHNNIKDQSKLKVILFVGDSHTTILKNFYKKNLYGIDKLVIKNDKQYLIDFLGIKGGSISGLHKNVSKTMIQKLLYEKIESYNTNNITIFMRLGFVDLHNILCYKINGFTRKQLEKYIVDNINQYENIIKKLKKDYTIIIESIIPSPIMENYNYYEKWLKKNKYDLSGSYKKFYFDNYDIILDIYNKKLKSISMKNNIQYIDNNKYYKILSKHYTITSDSKYIDHHYIGNMYLLIFIKNLYQYLKLDYKNNAKMMLDEYKKYIFSVNKKEYKKINLNKYIKNISNEINI